MDPVLSHHTSQERQPAAVPELPNNKPHQSPKQNHAEDHTKQTKATSGENHRDLQPTHSMLEISPAPARPLPCLHGLQEGLRQGLACSFVDNHEEVHQKKTLSKLSKTSVSRPLVRLLQQQHRRLVPNNSWSPTGMSTLTHPLRHISGKRS